jgi:predicted metal-dependent hydrolase
MEKYSFSLDGRIFEYFLITKDLKSVRLKVDNDSNIIVSASKSISQKFIENFIYQNKSYIDKHIAQKKQANERHNISEYKTGEHFLLFGEKKNIAAKKFKQNSIFLENDTLYILSVDNDIDTRKKLFEKFIKKTAKPIFLNKVDEIYPRFSDKVKKVPKISIRMMKTRWGSAKPSDNKITLNAKMIYADEKMLEMVVIHEFCHFYHLNHSKEFYDLLESFVPHYKKAMKAYSKLYSNLN